MSGKKATGVGMADVIFGCRGIGLSVHVPRPFGRKVIGFAAVAVGFGSAVTGNKRICIASQ